MSLRTRKGRINDVICETGNPVSFLFQPWSIETIFTDSPYLQPGNYLLAEQKAEHYCLDPNIVIRDELKYHKGKEYFLTVSWEHFPRLRVISYTLLLHWSMVLMHFLAIWAISSKFQVQNMHCRLIKVLNSRRYRWVCIIAGKRGPSASPDRSVGAKPENGGRSPFSGLDFCK